jgi:hypothetical protein
MEHCVNFFLSLKEIIHSIGYCVQAPFKKVFVNQFVVSLLHLRISLDVLCSLSQSLCLYMSLCIVMCDIRSIISLICLSLYNVSILCRLSSYIPCEIHFVNVMCHIVIPHASNAVIGWVRVYFHSVAACSIRPWLTISVDSAYSSRSPILIHQHRTLTTPF